MDRTEFVAATAVILFAAFVLGWFASWLVQRLTRGGKAEIGELDRMAQALHEAEEARDLALTYLEQSEAELAGDLAQSRAELDAAMDGLRAARHEADELRAWIERNDQVR